MKYLAKIAENNGYAGRITNVINVLNDYFFDVDPEEAPDYVGAGIFYGVITLMLLILSILTLATLIGA